MSTSVPRTAAWGDFSSDAQQHQYPPNQQQNAVQQAYPAPTGYPAAALTAQYPSEVAAAASHASAWQQPMQAQPAGQHQPYAAAQPSSFGSTANLHHPQQQPQHPQYHHSEIAQRQQEYMHGDGPASGADGTRGLGTGLMGGAHQVQKVGLAMHHIAHPLQGVKYHTVDKVKRKLKGKVCHLVDKVMP